MSKWLSKYKKSPESPPIRTDSTDKAREQYFDRKFKDLLQEVTAPDLDDGYLDFPDDANQAAIGAAERKLGAAWARGLTGDKSAVKDFDQALEELRKAFMKSIEDYKKR